MPDDIDALDTQPPTAWREDILAVPVLDTGRFGFDHWRRSVDVVEPSLA